MELNEHARGVDDIVISLRQLFAAGAQAPAANRRPDLYTAPVPARDHGFRKPAGSLSGAARKAGLSPDSDFDGF